MSWRERIAFARNESALQHEVLWGRGLLKIVIAKMQLDELRGKGPWFEMFHPDPAVPTTAVGHGDFGWLGQQPSCTEWYS